MAKRVQLMMKKLAAKAEKKARQAAKKENLQRKREAHEQELLAQSVAELIEITGTPPEENPDRTLALRPSMEILPRTAGNLSVFDWLKDQARLWTEAVTQAAHLSTQAATTIYFFKLPNHQYSDFHQRMIMTAGMSMSMSNYFFYEVFLEAFFRQITPLLSLENGLALSPKALVAHDSSPFVTTAQHVEENMEAIQQTEVDDSDEERTLTDDSSDATETESWADSESESTFNASASETAESSDDDMPAPSTTTAHPPLALVFATAAANNIVHHEIDEKVIEETDDGWTII